MSNNDRDRDDDGQFEPREPLNEHKPLYTDYTDWLQRHTNNQNTIDVRSGGAEKFLGWCEDTGHDPAEIGDKEVRAYIDFLVDNGASEPFTAAQFVSLSKFYRWFMTSAEHDIDKTDNPTDDIHLGDDYKISNTAEYRDIVHRQGRQDIIAPPYDDLKPLFDHVPGDDGFIETRNELLCKLCWQTALRSDELSRVRKEKVEIDDRDIEVRSSKLNRDDHSELFHRHVFYEPNLDYLIRRYLNKREKKKERHDSDCPRLFIGDRGGGLEPGTISRIVKDAAHNAGIQEPLTTNADGTVKRWLYTAHRLRHSRITHLANKTDMDLNHIRMMAGHAQISTTLDYVEADWDAVQTSFKSATSKDS